jgi:hypothetical protein
MDQQHLELARQAVAALRDVLTRDDERARSHPLDHTSSAEDCATAGLAVDLPGGPGKICQSCPHGYRDSYGAGAAAA